MVKKILFLILALAAIGGGLYGGGRWRYEKQIAADDEKKKAAGISKKTEFVKLTKSLTLPLPENGKVVAMLIAEIYVEGEEGIGEIFKSKEPLLRDALLQVMYKHATRGAFREKLLTERTQADLRFDMTETAKKIFGEEKIKGVLMSDFQRQEMQ